MHTEANMECWANKCCAFPPADYKFLPSASTFESDVCQHCYLILDYLLVIHETQGVHYNTRVEDFNFCLLSTHFLFAIYQIKIANRIYTYT